MDSARSVSPHPPPGGRFGSKMATRLSPDAANTLNTSLPETSPPGVVSRICSGHSDPVIQPCQPFISPPSEFQASESKVSHFASGATVLQTKSKFVGVSS